MTPAPITLDELRALVPHGWTLDERFSEMRRKLVVCILDGHDFTRLWVAGPSRQLNRRMALSALKELSRDAKKHRD